MEQTSIAYMMGKPTKQNYYIEPEKAELAADPVTAYMSKEELEKQLKLVQNNMEKAAKELDFIAAARLRDEMLALKKLLEKK
ncbi:UvrB/UvrC motif-containing protein [Flectobacillus roseus]|uniref:UvrB/UvrC motif-containing protein n=1 Tax=Flectobacillus roseus TaxID=502259 RepID=UPI0024B824A6|nr:UvrB/UvrC motif-containing protein [Flectobacillus roseus]MDI9869057.1 UvrB/UvrC motif-containing protein [Flectobacillus roseus]